MTPTERKVLEIVEHRSVRGREMARALWPNSPGWDRIVKCGPSGSTTGGGMPMAAGGYCGKMSRRTGWITYSGWQNGWSITDKGMAALCAARKK